MISKESIILKEIDTLNARYFNARESSLKYINLYLYFIGTVVTISLFFLEKKPEYVYMILPLLAVILTVGMLTFYVSLESTSIVIWSIYRIDKIKIACCDDRILREVILLDKMSILPIDYIGGDMVSGIFKNKIYRFFYPFALKNYREKLVIFVNCFLFYIFIYVLNENYDLNLSRLMLLSLVLLFFSIQAKYMIVKLKTALSLLLLLQTDKF